MFEVENLNSLNDDEIMKLYEMFFGPVLIKKSTDSYKTSLKTLLVNPEAIEKIFEKMNTLERETIELLSILSTNEMAFINEKISIIYGEHPSIISKVIANLINKHLIFTRDDKFLIVPIIFLAQAENKKVELIPDGEECNNNFDNPIMSSINSVILYLLAKQVKYSKTGTLYKKDFEDIDQLFKTSAGFSREEYSIIAYFCYKSFHQDDETDWVSVKDYFNLTAFEKMYRLIRVVFPHLSFLLDQIEGVQKNLKMRISDFKFFNTYLLLAAKYKEEPYKINNDALLVFLKKLSFCVEEQEMYTFRCYNNFSDSNMDMKLGSNYTLFYNTLTNDGDCHKCAVYGDFIKSDKFTEFEITEQTIRRSIKSGFSWETFNKFVCDHNIELLPNVETTIKGWFEKHSSYFTIKGTVFFAESEEKGRIISRLIEEGHVIAHEMKKNLLYLIPEEKSDEFFAFLDKSQITYFNRRPITTKRAENILGSNYIFDSPELIDIKLDSELVEE